MMQHTKVIIGAGSPARTGAVDQYIGPWIPDPATATDDRVSVTADY